MNFKVGDYVKIKDGLELAHEEVTKNWAGQIVDYDAMCGIYYIKLDAKTINALSDALLPSCVYCAHDFPCHDFEEQDLNLSKRQDDDLAYEFAKEMFYLRLEDLDVDVYDEMTFAENLLEDFCQSEYYHNLYKLEQEYAIFGIRVFNELNQTSPDEPLDKLAPYRVRELCLNAFPEKVSVDAEFFENLGGILTAYFKFLGERGFIQNAEELCETLKKIDKLIAKEARDPKKLGMHKSIFMDIERCDDDEFDDYTARLEQLSLEDTALPVMQDLHTSLKPKRKIGRNEKVTVRYPDGTIKEGIKYKKVMEELETNQCELVED